MMNVHFTRQRLKFLAGALLLLSTVSASLAQNDEPSGRRRVKEERSLFQVSRLDAFSLGLYQGVYSISHLRQHGNFGLGTFEGIDGEMTVLDGHFYHFRSDGSLTEEPDSTQVPFAVVTEFQPQFRFKITGKSFADLGSYIDQFLPSSNLFYAIRIQGVFTSLTTRAIPKLSPPYPPLAELLPRQVVFSYHNVPGTLVAFRCPAYAQGLNQVGYHYHFISDDRKIGGHCLDFVTGPVTIEVETLRENSVWLPSTPGFLNAPIPTSR